jgi:CoA:oxalate CoA-transferase
MRVGFPAVDTYAGTLAALAILAALVRRSATGQGQRIDLAMFDASLVLTAAAAVPYLVTGRAMKRTGNTGYSGQPTAAMFPTMDGRSVSLGVVQQEQYERLCRALGRSDLLSDARFATPDARMTNAAAMRVELGAEFARRDGEAIEAELSKAGVACGLVRTIGEACEMPHLGARGIIHDFKAGLPSSAQGRALNAGFLCDADGPELSGPPPRLGEHTREQLARLGFAASEIDEMIASGAAASG